MLDSGWNNTVGREFVPIISDTSVKHLLIKFDFIEERSYKLPLRLLFGMADGQRPVCRR